MHATRVSRHGAVLWKGMRATSPNQRVAAPASCEEAPPHRPWPRAETRAETITTPLSTHSPPSPTFKVLKTKQTKKNKKTRPCGPEIVGGDGAACALLWRVCRLNEVYFLTGSGSFSVLENDETISTGAAGLPSLCMRACHEAD